LFQPEAGAEIRVKFLVIHRQSKARRVLRHNWRIFSATLVLALMKILITPPQNAAAV